MASRYDILVSSLHTSICSDSTPPQANVSHAFHITTILITRNAEKPS